MRFVFFIWLLLSSFVLQSQVVRGTIVDEQGVGVPFAKVRLQNKAYGTVSNALGIYQIELDQGEHILIFSASGYESKVDTLRIDRSIQEWNVVLMLKVQEVDEVVITYASERDRGKEIMKEVIAKRKFFQESLREYSNSTYCFSSLEKDRLSENDSVEETIGKEKMNVIEWESKSSFKSPNRYKDVFTAYQDYSEGRSGPATVTMGVDIDMGRTIAPQGGLPVNPYLFVRGIRDFHFSLFDNTIEEPKLTRSPLISPLAFDALVHYHFYLKGSFLDENGGYVYEIFVEPRFQYEALFEGTLFIRKDSWELVSCDLAINPQSLIYFKEMQLVADYKKVGDRLVPTRREFVYSIKEGKTRIYGRILLNHSNYTFSVDDTERKFWLEESVYSDDAFDKDSSYWNEQRPFALQAFEARFLREQDSIQKYQESDAYHFKQDSIRNRITFLSVLFGEIGYANSKKGYAVFLPGLIQQVVPFGVGGYRHRLSPTYDQELKSGKEFSINPYVDYGFRNGDLKGGLSGSFMFDPLHFTRVGFDIGDVYDFISSNQNIQGTLAPANRVRNQKVEINFRRELVNGLYMKAIFHYSDRQSIEGIEYPEWVQVFGDFQNPQPFERYKIFLTTFDFEYHFRQRYIIKNGRKYVLGSPWPVLNIQYKKAIPQLFGTEANFDFLEFRLRDEINLKQFGNSEVNFVGGAFLQKTDLRVIEHTFFRPSDRYFFSNPVYTMQLLDTALNTNNSYAQLNFIHHFNGLFLNKVWGLNRLKLEETIGGGLLLIPDANFTQFEFYAGVERAFRIRRELFKIGVYGVTQVNTLSKASVHLKIGFNMYNAFRDKWDY